MDTDKMLVDANRKWLEKRGVKDARTLLQVRRLTARYALHALKGLAEHYNAWLFLASVNHDGTERANVDQSDDRRLLVALAHLAERLKAAKAGKER